MKLTIHYLQTRCKPSQVNHTLNKYTAQIYNVQQKNNTGTYTHALTVGGKWSVSFIIWTVVMCGDVVCAIR